MHRSWIILIVGLWVVGGWAQEGQDFQLWSPAFEDGGTIPVKYTCDGENLSPPLRWKGLPEGARYVVLIVDDPDAPTHDPFVHWVAYHIPAAWRKLDEGISGRGGSDFAEGINDFKRRGWAGPCPPRTHGTHRYYFKLYAVKGMPILTPGLRKQEVLQAIGPYVLDRTTLIGTYQRKRP